MTPTRGAALYVLVEVTDDQLVSDSTNTWDDDGIELFIDADNSKKTGYGRNDFQYSVRWNGSLSEFKQSATANVTMAQSQTASGHVVELTLPWTTLKGTPGAGAFIGLDVHVNDDDNGGGRDGKLAWFGTTDNAWQTPKALANAKLDDLVGTGLTGQYFASTYFATLRLTRLDPQVDFDWAHQAPAANVPHDLFSVRWTGSLMAPVSGTHTISVRSDDGTRLWLNGEQLINDWVGRSAATSSNTVTLSAGVAVPIRLECFDRWGQAVAALSWTRPDGTAEVIPTRFLFPADLAP